MYPIWWHPLCLDLHDRLGITTHPTGLENTDRFLYRSKGGAGFLTYKLIVSLASWWICYLLNSLFLEEPDDRKHGDEHMSREIDARPKVKATGTFFWMCQNLHLQLSELYIRTSTYVWYAILLMYQMLLSKAMHIFWESRVISIWNNWGLRVLLDILTVTPVWPPGIWPNDFLNTITAS